MTYGNPASSYPQPGNANGLPGGPKRRLSTSMRNTVVVLVAVVTLVSAGVIGYVIGASTHGSTHTDQIVAGSSVLPIDAEPAAVATAGTTPAQQFTATDFRVDLTIVGQECFGTAGCNVTYTIDPTYRTGPLSDLDGRNLRIVYEVTGGEQPQIGNFTSDGSTIWMPETMMISTSAPGAELAAHVTKVIDRG